MEATQFGFDPSLPPVYKFDPTDADLVTHYLLPRAVGHPNPYAHAVIDADPCSCPPWELMRRHGHAGSDHAFFFGPVAARTDRGGRRSANRSVPAWEGGGGGGAWHGQATGVERSLVLERGGAGGAQMEIKFEKRTFSYYDKEEKRTTGWVMDEYEVTHPPFPGVVLSRIRITVRAKKKRQQQQQLAAADQHLVPGPEQPGPVVAGNGEGTSGGAQAEVLHQCDNNGGFMGDAAGHDALSSIREHGSLLGETAAGYYSGFPQS